MKQKIKRLFRKLFNSKEVTKKDYKNSNDLIKQRLDELRKK